MEASNVLAPASTSLRTQDGLRLCGEQVAASAALQAVLAHGFGQTRQSWSATQSALAAQDVGSLAFDARGHGESERNPIGCSYSADQFIADISTAAGSIATTESKPVLIGASMGGLCGLVAQSRQSMFSALVLVDVTPRWESEGLRRILGFMRAHPQGFADFAHAADEIAAYLPHRTERKTPEQLRPLLRSDADGRLQWHWDPRLISEFAEHSDHLQERIAEAARAITVPTLLISGGRSDLVSRRTVEDFLACVPQARHVELPQATHMLAGDDNHAFTHAVLEFLGAHFPLSLRTRGAAIGVAV